MKRKLVALTLAMTTLMSSAMMVNAEANVTDVTGAVNGQEITGEATISLPTIKVTVPTTADIVINPFQMSYDNDGIKGSSQIISAEQEIINESNVAVAVNVKDLEVASASDGISIATAAISSKDTTKSAFIYLEVTEGDFQDGYTKAATQLVATKVDGVKVKAGASKDAIVTLKDGSSTATKAKFKIGGSVVANPVTVDSETKAVTEAPWTDEDEISLKFKFTFTPQITTTAAP